MEYECGARLMEVFSLFRFMRDLLPQRMPIPIGEFMMLEAISMCEGDSPPGGRISYLSAQTHMAMPAVSRMLGSLEQRGLISRQADSSDRRAVYVSLTQEGFAQLAQLNAFVYAHLDPTARRFGMGNITRLEELLRALIAALPSENRKEER